MSHRDESEKYELGFARGQSTFASLGVSQYFTFFDKGILPNALGIRIKNSSSNHFTNQKRCLNERTQLTRELNLPNIPFGCLRYVLAPTKS